MGQSSMTLDVPAKSLIASLEDLTPAQVYQVTVRANTSVGFGSSSEPVRATTEMDSECDHTHCTPATHNTTRHTHNTQLSTPRPQHTALHTIPTTHNTTHSTPHSQHYTTYYTPHTQHTTLHTPHHTHNTTLHNTAMPLLFNTVTLHVCFVLDTLISSVYSQW